MDQTLKSYLLAQLKVLDKYRIRQLIILVGEVDFAYQYVELIEQQGSRCLVYSQYSEIVSDIQPYEVKKYLGTEASHIALLPREFEPTTFALLTGVLRGGGVMLLHISPENIQTSRFARYFVNQCRQHDFHLVIEQASFDQVINDQTINNQRRQVTALAQDIERSQLYLRNKLPLIGVNDSAELSQRHCLTLDQSQAVNTILENTWQHDHSVTVITADRGRGKSSALAISCVNLLAKDLGNKSAGQNTGSNFDLNTDISIGISAPKKSSLSVFYQQLDRSIAQLAHDSSQQEQLRARVKFYPLDELVLASPELNILMVDEASGIPVPQLQSLAANYSHVVFATTIHGYEGAGRGFTFKFLNHLSERAQRRQISLKQYHLHQPIRWASDCPLEQFSFDSLLLNAEIKPISNADIADQVTCFEFLDKNQLAEHNEILREIFALLVSAHYQTSTSDLMLILDHPAIDVYRLTIAGQLVGVALMIQERELPSDIRAEVIAGARRVRDHFTAQSLIQHLGFDSASALSFYRVMRIAIHPNLQSLGLGHHLLGELEKQAVKLRFDALSTSFGVNDKLLNFWRQNQFSLLRLGLKKDQASGEYSGLLVKPLSSEAQRLKQQAREQFTRSFETLHAISWQALPTAVVNQIEQEFVEVNVLKVCDYDLKALSDFACGRRQLLNCIHGIKVVLLDYLASHQDLSFAALISFVVEQQPLKKVCQQYGFSGKKAFESYCRQVCNELIKQGYR
ncbi:tRNA(Met) cytidine acetyltransferase [Thalassotalea sp. LPB0316]|uniref:GNAT family N-acetyltransferase n=1 Tax=Thalassotalea sp. LPB0316 TaxID=2769490 RepID=UPI0018682132|nr:GNAT family N-acetyltransferase [Thalassotalea sp. LPB0316]QOL26967.1 tRNA(Met) cytidine acetyltransferase [Thalassotalea sp. LPB0316]